MLADNFSVLFFVDYVSVSGCDYSSCSMTCFTFQSNINVEFFWVFRLAHFNVAAVNKCCSFFDCFLACVVNYLKSTANISACCSESCRIVHSHVLCARNACRHRVLNHVNAGAYFYLTNFSFQMSSGSSRCQCDSCRLSTACCHYHFTVKNITYQLMIHDFSLLNIHKKLYINYSLFHKKNTQSIVYIYTSKIYYR